MSGFGATPGKAMPISASRPDAKPEELIESSFPEDLIVAGGHAALNEDLALALLRRRDLPSPAIEALARNHLAMKHRKILLHIVQHHRTPRHVSLPILRRLFVFELMHLALTPAVTADIKLLAEEMLIAKLETVSLGECISLARQSSTAVAGALLRRKESSVIEAALQNPHMTELGIVKSLGKPDVPPLLLAMLADHAKWFLRREIQLAILRRPEASEAVVKKVASQLPKGTLQQVLKQMRLPEGTKELLRNITGSGK
jgi:hypothetical protein